jgi:hypothetical protein
MIFVFDGGLPNYKRGVRIQRFVEQRQRQTELIAALHWTDSFASPLALPCMIHTLLELKQAVFMAYEEADRVVARFAKEKGYHVLSNDSDYYFFDIIGYAPLGMVLWEDRPLLQVARRSDIARRMRLPESMLSVFATLCGSDRFPMRGPKAVALRNQNPKLRQKGNLQRKYTQIIQWIHNERTDDVRVFLDRFGAGLRGLEKVELMDAILENAKEYAIVMEEEMPCFEIVLSNAPLLPLPLDVEHVQQYIENGRALGILREILTKNEFWRRPFVEDPTHDSYEISYPIRCFLYKTLNLPVREGMVEHGEVVWITMEPSRAINIPTLQSEIDLILFIVRHLLFYSDHPKEAIEKALQGLLVSMYTHVEPWVDRGRVSVDSIRMTSEIETILFSLGLLSPFWIPLPLGSFWNVFEPALIHRALNQGLAPPLVETASLRCTGLDFQGLWSQIRSPLDSML